MAAHHVLTGSLLLALVACAWGCAVPHGGCRAEICDQYAGVSVATVAFPTANYDDPATWSQGSLPLIGYYLGRYNKLVNNGSYNRAGIKGTPALNFERFDLETGVVDPRTGLPFARLSGEETTLVSCCRKCAATDGCYLFQFFPPGAKAPQCYLLSGGTATWDWPERGTPNAGSARRQAAAPRVSIAPSFVGGRCNGSTGVYDDPHFTGARGTRFDFNGQLDRAFCLTSDARLHINGLLKGYREARKDGATVGADGKALRTWIREVGLVWRDEQGQRRTLHLVARDGKEQGHGRAGFVSSAALDGKPFSLPTQPGNGAKDGDLSVVFMGTSTVNRIEADTWRVKIGSLLDLSLSARVAHPSMQQPGEAHAHFNLLLNSLATSARVHGVLGQTYRATAQQQAKALRYTQITRLLNGPIQADGRTGEGFLEGSTEDYVSSSILNTDCRFASFQ